MVRVAREVTPETINRDQRGASEHDAVDSRSRLVLDLGDGNSHQHPDDLRAEAGRFFGEHRGPSWSCRSRRKATSLPHARSSTAPARLPTRVPVIVNQRRTNCHPRPRRTS